MFSLSVRMIFNELAECFIGYPPFPCLLSPPIFEQRVLFFALYILITFQFGADEHFSSHSAKTSQNKMILDISCVADGIRKNAASHIRLAALENRIHLLSNSLFVCCRDCCFFSSINISQILSLVISKDPPICLHLFANQIRTGRMTASSVSTSEHPALLQSNLPAIDSKIFTDWGSLLLLSRIRTVPLPPDSVKRWAHFHRDGSLGA